MKESRLTHVKPSRLLSSAKSLRITDRNGGLDVDINVVISIKAFKNEKLYDHLGVFPSCSNFRCTVRSL